MTEVIRVANAGGVQATNKAKRSKGKLTAKSTESQVLLPENEKRVGAYVFNPSSKEVWLALGETATKEEGIWLKKEAGSVFIQGYTGPVAVITTSEEGSVSYVEI